MEIAGRPRRSRASCFGGWKRGGNDRGGGRAVALSAEGVIRGDAFSTGWREGGTPVPGSNGPPRRPPESPIRLSDAVDAAEREAIQRALEAADGNRNAAAKALGISVRNLFYKIKQLDL